MVLEKKLAYIFFYFKLFLCPPDVKTLNFSRVLLSWTPTRAPAWIYCKAYRTLRPSLGFYSMQKLNLCSKTDISKTAWINAWPHIIAFLKNKKRYGVSLPASFSVQFLKKNISVLLGTTWQNLHILRKNNS